MISIYPQDEINPRLIKRRKGILPVSRKVSDIDNSTTCSICFNSNGKFKCEICSQSTCKDCLLSSICEKCDLKSKKKCLCFKF